MVGAALRPCEESCGFPRVPLESLLLCRGECRWGTGDRFSVAHPAAQTLGQRIHQVVDCKHYRTNHEQSQYEGQLYINGHALYSLGPVVGAFYAAKSAMPSMLEG